MIASTDKINLLNLDLKALSSVVSEWGDKPFRAKQLVRWIHERGCDSFDEMTDLAKDFRQRLSMHAQIQGVTAILAKQASDGTRKWLFDMGQTNAIETVFIPEDDRGTLCISSQVGCTVACRFCSTGHQGFSRNLTTAEIIGQLWYARRELTDHIDLARTKSSTTPIKNVISNVVMMGMGEPLLNYDALLPALRLMLDDHAYGLSRRRVTVSTSGVVPLMDRLSQDCPVALAVSLHAPNDRLRDQLIPLNKKFPLKSLLDACERYLAFAPRDFITFEYIMLDGVNDTPEHAQQLIQIAKSIRCKLNLIPFNPFPASGLKRSTHQRVREFAQTLQDAGVMTTVRKTRGDDIDAACGQLAGDVKDKTKISAKMAIRKTIPIQEVL